MFDHPKFGIIPGVMTLQDVQEGEEVCNIKRAMALNQRHIFPLDCGVVWL